MVLLAAKYHLRYLVRLPKLENDLFKRVRKALAIKKGTNSAFALSTSFSIHYEEISTKIFRFQINMMGI